MLEGISGILFDLDGTLVDSMGIWAQIDVDYLKRFGYANVTGIQRAIEGMTVRETAVYFKEQFQIPDPIETMMGDWHTMALDKYRHEVGLKPGAKEMLDWCRTNHIRTALATTNSSDLTDAVLDALSIRDYFDSIRTANEIGRGKPFPDLFLFCAKEIGVEPASCLVFEDTEMGIRAGLAAGMKVCAVYDENSSDRSDAKRELADYFITDFRDLTEEMEALKGGMA